MALKEFERLMTSATVPASVIKTLTSFLVLQM
jgi:hypothetical protein